MLIRGISSKSFLAFFSNVECLEDIDIDFLEIGFAEVTKVHWTNLYPSRRTWIECRGLLIVSWTEENFKALMKPLGKILHFSPIVNENGFYQYPKIQIETSIVHNICQEVVIEVKGVIFNVLMQEAHVTTNLDKDSSPFMLSAGDILKDRKVMLDEGELDSRLNNNKSFMENSLVNQETNQRMEGELINDEEKSKSSEFEEQRLCQYHSRVSDS